MADNETTTIRMSLKTKERFDKLGNYGESADDILNRLMDALEKARK